MFYINRITTAPRQTQNIIIPTVGDAFKLSLYFIPMQQGWFITELTYGTFTLKGLRITNSPNLLYQWRNLLPFGLGCFSKDNREPSLQDDFFSGASRLYVLTAAEVLEYSEFITSGN